MLVFSQIDCSQILVVEGSMMPCLPTTQKAGTRTIALALAVNTELLNRSQPLLQHPTEGQEQYILITTMMVRLATIFVTVSALAPSVLAQTCATINPAQAPTFASGYSGRVVMNGLRTPRSIIFDNSGNLLTVEQGGYGVRYIQLTDNGGTNVCVKANKQLISDATMNHGIALSPDGKKLYVSSQIYVWSWDYDGTTGTVSNKKTLIQGMKQGGFHLTRTLLVPKGRPDLLLVQRGSQDNIDTAAGQIGTARSQIRVFKIADIEKGVVEYSSGEVLAWGIRNTVGFGEDSKGGIVSSTSRLQNVGLMRYVSGLWKTAWTTCPATEKTSITRTHARS